MTGHLLGAAGVRRVGGLRPRAPRTGVMPPTINYTNIRIRTATWIMCRTRPGMPSRSVALNNSLGFGGHNATLCFKAI
jgi:3-oxoacyl-[acyl-carrier-protein] synthase II